MVKAAKGKWGYDYIIASSGDETLIFHPYSRNRRNRRRESPGFFYVIKEGEKLRTHSPNEYWQAIIASLSWEK